MIPYLSRSILIICRKHVLRDLEPYICTFPSCSLDSFQSQHAWFDHELLIHRARWTCPNCPASFFDTADSLRQHIRLRHSEIISERQLSAIVEQSKRSVDVIRPGDCPFCDEPWAESDSDIHKTSEILVVSPEQFRHHLGHHLQQVAMFALPRRNQHSESRQGSNAVVGSPDRDDISQGYRWVRSDCGRGWSIVSNSRLKFFALAAFNELLSVKMRKKRLGMKQTSVFGVSLVELSRREHKQVPAIVSGCIDCVELYAMHLKDIYVSSYESEQVIKLMEAFDQGEYTSAQLCYKLFADRAPQGDKQITDFTETEKWQCHICKAGPHLCATSRKCTGVVGNGRKCGHEMCRHCKKDKDIPPPMGTRFVGDEPASHAVVLKVFLRQLPTPLLPADFAAALDEAPGLYGHIGGTSLVKDLLPDSHYETLNALMLHLKRVSDLCEINGMNPERLATIFAPILFGSDRESAIDTALDIIMDQTQVRAETQERFVERLITSFAIVSTVHVESGSRN